MSERQAVGRRIFRVLAGPATLVAVAGAVSVTADTARRPIALLAAAASSVPAAPQSFPPPLAEGPAPDLVLAITAQVAGWIEPCG